MLMYYMKVTWVPLSDIAGLNIDPIDSEIFDFFTLSSIALTWSKFDLQMFFFKQVA